MSEPAFIFADLVGFSSFTDTRGDEAAADLAIQFCEQVCEINEGHRAEDVKMLGDGSMIHVPDVRCAVEMGLEIVEAIGPSHGLLRVRVGIDSGPAVERHGDWFGATVNRAARLVTLADEGSVFVTGRVRSFGLDIKGVRYDERGSRQLKGIAEPVDVYIAKRVRQ